MFKMFTELLLRADASKLAQHSRVSHHGVPGFDYLCLHRSEELTVKIYWILNNSNPNDGFLVNPHNHRYTFDTTVLGGSVEHLLFENVEGGFAANHVVTYNANGGHCKATMSNKRGACLIERDSKIYATGESYRVAPDEIHTLRIHEACILGIVQYADTREKTELYFRGEVLPRCKEPQAMSQAAYDTMRRELYNHFNLSAFPGAL